MRSLLTVLFVFAALISFAQKKQCDTLFLWGKKYALETGPTFKYAPYNFPFMIAEHHYKYLYTEKQYTSVDESKCVKQAMYTADGDELISYLPKNAGTRAYTLDEFADSLAIDLSDLSKVAVKTPTGKHLVEKIQFKLIFDSTIVMINADINPVNQNFSSKIKTAFFKVKPKFIVLNEMLYTDRKGQMQAIPRQFILTLK